MARDGKIIPEPTRMKVKRAAPGGEGLVIDPFSPAALRTYLAPFETAFAQLPKGMVRGQFHDSFEYYGANWTAQSYTQSKGKDLYRRTMYTFWKRTCPPPSLATLDAPDRETCVVRRSRTNTPLQALVLMNDPTYVESARKFAERLMTEHVLVSRQRLQASLKQSASAAVAK